MVYFSHPFFQDYLWKKACGKKFHHFHNFHLHWKFYYTIGAILIFFTYPFIIIFDIMFGNNDIMFLSPEMKEAEDQSSGCCPENRCIEYYRKIMHRPVFRIVVHHFMELIFLFTLSLSCIDPLDVPNKLDVHFYDYAAGIIIFTIANALTLKVF